MSRHAPGHGRPRRPPVTRNVPVTAPARGLLLTLTLLTTLGPLVAGFFGRAATPAAPAVRDRRCIAASRGRFIGRLAREGRSTAAPESNAPRLRLRRASRFPAHPSRTYPGVGAAPPCPAGSCRARLVVPAYTHRHRPIARGRASACHGPRQTRLWGNPRPGRRASAYTPVAARLCVHPVAARLCVHPGRGAPLRHPVAVGTSAYDRVRSTSGNDRLASPSAAADMGWSPRQSDQRWSMTSTLTTVAPLASAIAGPFPAYRTHGRDAAAFRIVLSGVRMTPERPPGNAFAAGFSGLALARALGRRGRRR